MKRCDPLHAMLLGGLLVSAGCAGQDGSSTLSGGDTAGAMPAAFSDFESAESCGMCHPQHYEEWRQSMHAYATRSPVFQAMAAKAYRDSAGSVGTFCTRCHSIIGDLQGDGGDVSFDERSSLAQEGVTCDICHTATHTLSPLGNAYLEHDPGGARFGPYADAADDDHDVGVGSLQTTSQLCASCHDVYMFPGLAVEQAYTEFADSPAAAAGQRCQDCHMGPQPGVVSDRVVEPIAQSPDVVYPARERSTHRFIGPDYALVDDWPYPDDLEASAAAQLDALDQIQILLENAVTIAGVDIVNAQDDTGANVVAVDVSIESLVAGHRVPTGFTSERQLWVDITVQDAGGQTILRSGDLDSMSDLRDVHSFDVQAGLVDLDEQLVNLQSVNRTFVRSYDESGQFSSDVTIGEATFPFEAQEIVRNSLEPLDLRTVRYYTSVNSSTGLTVQVALRYRNLPPYVLRALGAESLVERLHVFTLNSISVVTP